MADVKAIEKIIGEETIKLKKFNYRVGAVALNFSLDPKKSEDMKDFIALLQTAQKDVEEEIKTNI